MDRDGEITRIGNLSDAEIETGVTAAEEMEGEDKGPEAHQGAGPAAEKEGDQSLILDRIELTTEEHLGRVRTTMKEEKRRDHDGRKKPRLKSHQQMHQLLSRQIHQVRKTKTLGEKKCHNQRQ